MRILRVHNHYRQRGGEDVTFEAESALLERKGHALHRLEFANDDIAPSPSLISAFKLAGNTVWSRTARKRIATVVDEFRPDVVHFDNTFPLVSPAAYGVVNRRGVPVVQTLHNYRLLCPSTLLYHEGELYESSIGKLIPYRAVWDGVYRNSRLQTGVLAVMLIAHRLLGTWDHNVDRFICLTEFAQGKFLDGGLPADKLVIKPNFVEEIIVDQSKPRENYMVFVGRLSVEKGIETLVAAQHFHKSPMRVVGDGAMMRIVSSAQSREDGLMVMGRLPHDRVYQEMAVARAVVVPSESYETFGLTAVEAFAHGTPVIATRLGSMAEVVEDGVTGLLFEPGNAEDLAAKITWAHEHPSEMRRMGEKARWEYEAKYTPERNYELLMDIYQQAIDHARRRRA